MADWVEVEVLLDSRFLDGWGRKSGMGFFPYFSASSGLFCLLSKKVSGDLLVLFLPVSFIIKDLIMDLAMVSTVGATTLIAGMRLIVDGVAGSTTLDGVIDRRVGVCQVWRGVVHELGWEVDGRAKEGDGGRRGGILGGTWNRRHTGLFKSGVGC